MAKAIQRDGATRNRAAFLNRVVEARLLGSTLKMLIIRSYVIYFDVVTRLVNDTEIEET